MGGGLGEQSVRIWIVNSYLSTAYHKLNTSQGLAILVTCTSRKKGKGGGYCCELGGSVSGMVKYAHEVMRRLDLRDRGACVNKVKMVLTQPENGMVVWSCRALTCQAQVEAS